MPTPRWTLALVLALVAGAAVPARAATADRAEAVRSLVQRLVDGASLAKGASCLIDDVRGSAEAPSVQEALVAAFVAAGVKVVDRKTLKASLDEAAAQPANDAVLAEMAAALGAHVLVLTEVSSRDGAHTITGRLVLTETGAIAATASAAYGDMAAAGAPTGRSLEAELRRLADRLAEGLAKLGGETRYEQFAVLPFEETGETTKDKQLGVLVASELTTVLHRDHQLLLVERASLSRVVDELALGQTGLVDPAKAAEVGRLAGAQGLIVGSVSEVGDRYRVNARVVDVASAAVVATEEATLPAADLVALSSDAVVLRTRSGAIYRSLLLPGWGQFYNREPLKGVVFVGAEVAAVGLAVTFHLLGMLANDRYQGLNGASDPAAFDQLARERNQDWQLRTAFIIAAVSVHALNVLDAAVFGKSYDSATPGASGAGSWFRF